MLGQRPLTHQCPSVYGVCNLITGSDLIIIIKPEITQEKFVVVHNHFYFL